MLGASIYLSELNLDYLETLKSNNVKYLFTSFHIGEEVIENPDKKIADLINFTNENNIFLIPDVSPVTLEKLKVKDIKELKNLGIKAIRLDYGFDDLKYVHSLTELFIVVLNASVINKNYLDDLQKLGTDINKIIALHNFYPRVNTGLEKSEFTEINLEIKNCGVKVQTFVTGDVKKRFPFYEGLPTLEKHRYINSYVAAIELLKETYSDDIFIGDSEASSELLELLKKLSEDSETVYIKAKLQKDFEHLYDTPLKKRKENPEDIVRLLTRSEKPVKQKYINKRYRGSITMDNELFGRYNGEIYICKKDLPGDSRVNVIGQIDNDFLEIIDYVKYFKNIIFIR